MLMDKRVKRYERYACLSEKRKRIGSTLREACSFVVVVLRACETFSDSGCEVLMLICRRVNKHGKLCFPVYKRKGVDSTLRKSCSLVVSECLKDFLRLELWSVDINRLNAERWRSMIGLLTCGHSKHLFIGGVVESLGDFLKLELRGFDVNRLKAKDWRIMRGMLTYQQMNSCSFVVAVFEVRDFKTSSDWKVKKSKRYVCLIVNNRQPWRVD